MEFPESGGRGEGSNENPRCNFLEQCISDLNWDLDQNGKYLSIHKSISFLPKSLMGCTTKVKVALYFPSTNQFFFPKGTPSKSFPKIRPLLINEWVVSDYMITPASSPGIAICQQ